LPDTVQLARRPLGMGKTVDVDMLDEL